MLLKGRQASVSVDILGTGFCSLALTRWMLCIWSNNVLKYFGEQHAGLYQL